MCIFLYTYKTFLLMPTHYTITFFGFRAIRIDGESVVYFRFTYILNKTTLLDISVLKN